MTAAAQRMARTRALCCVLVLLSGCASLFHRPTEAPPTAPIDPPRRSGKPLVMVAMPDSPSFHVVRRTLVSEIQKDFDVQTRIITADTTATDFRTAVEGSGAAGVVLMDNPTIKLYRAYQTARAGSGAPGAGIPAVVVMSSFLDEVSSQVPNSTGVTYEVPGVTAFVHLRDIIKRPVKRVGVVHRPVFRAFIERQRVLAAKEQVTLVSVAVSANPDAREVNAALRQLRAGGGVDALWVLNDNRLLRNARFLENAWRTEVGALDAAVIVGVEALVSEEAHFGTFAVVPDLDALGVQTANLVFEVAERNWSAEGIPIEQPVSTRSVGNLRELRQRFGLRPNALTRIDRIVD